jgi:predicted acyltransferase
MDLPPKERLLSLDAFRGMTIVGMILVNNAGDWSHVFPQLQHAAWHGWTLADLIFPFFLFIVGVAMSFSFAHRVEPGTGLKKVYFQIARRTLILFSLGLFLNALYYIPDALSPATLRIPGVLQRIAVVYCVASLLVLKTTPPVQALVAMFLLLGYWALLAFVPVPGYGAGALTPEGNLVAYLDNLLLHNHVEEPTDPEGLLSTIPAIATAILGALTGEWIRSRRESYEKVSALFVMGGVGVVVGMVWDRFLPINKPLWTGSYVMFTAGLALYFLALCYWLIDLQGLRRWATPFIAFGANAVSVYTLSIVMDRILWWVKVPQTDGSAVDLKTWIYEHAYALWAAPWFGEDSISFCYALTYTLVWLGPMWFLYRKRIFISI